MYNAHATVGCHLSAITYIQIYTYTDTFSPYVAKTSDVTPTAWERYLYTHTFVCACEKLAALSACRNINVAAKVAKKANTRKPQKFAT